MSTNVTPSTPGDVLGLRTKLTPGRLQYVASDSAIPCPRMRVLAAACGTWERRRKDVGFHKVSVAVLAEHERTKK